MAKMPQSLMELINTVPLCYLATASRDGVPDVAPLVTAVAVDAGTIAMAVTSQGKSATNVRENPRAALVVHSEPPSRMGASLGSISQVLGAQIKGTAAVLASGEVHDLVRRKTCGALGADAVDAFDATVVLKVEEVFSLVPGSRKGTPTP